MLRPVLMIAALIATLIAVAPPPAGAAEWRLDPKSRVAVDVAWRGSVVETRFPDISGQISFDAERPDRARALISVSARTATAGLGPVDRLMRGPDYLAAAMYPAITFRLERLVQTSRSTAEVSGQITFRGVTRPIAFAARVVRYGPAEDDPDRFEAGFDLTGSIDRRDFGSVAGYPDIAAVLPIRIRLLMVSG